MSAHLTYRPDIDGLRALAIVPVVLFHYAMPFFYGGFVGVDIFFVISGYIITSVIQSELADNSFTIKGFYERRIRRIVPALFVVFAVSGLAALVLFTPKDMVKIGSEFSWSCIFSTNFLFFRKDGYFEGASTMRVLLHTWSLSVEEQFYLLIPVLLQWGYRSFRQKLGKILLSMLVLSWVFSAFWVFRGPSAAFYLLPSRAWELLLGCVLALNVVPPSQKMWVRDAVGVGGILLIAVAVFGFTNATPFPGMAATLPCVGAAALIWSSALSPSLMGRVLSGRPIVAVGRISYSLYLWHWPLLVLAKYYLVQDPTLAQALEVMACAVFLSVLSYWYVERPFRSKVLLVNSRQVFAAGAVVLLLVGGFGRAAEFTKGFPGRLSPKAQHYAEMFGNVDPRHDACMKLTPSQFLQGDACSFGVAHNGSPDFAVWGDSHAGALIPLFQAEAEKHGAWGLLYGAPSCPPLLGVSVVRADLPDLTCPEFNDAVVSQLVSRSIHTVFFVSRWALYSEDWPRTGVDARNKPIFLMDAQSSRKAKEENRAVFHRGFARTLEQMKAHDIQVYVVEGIPEALADIPNGMATNTLLGRSSLVLAPKRDFVESRQSWVNALFLEAQGNHSASVIPTHLRLCDPQKCMVEYQDSLLYRDNNHPSVPGAHFLEPVFDPVFDTLSPNNTRTEP